MFEVPPEAPEAILALAAVCLILGVIAKALAYRQEARDLRRELALNLVVADTRWEAIREVNDLLQRDVRRERTVVDRLLEGASIVSGDTYRELARRGGEFPHGDTVPMIGQPR